MPLKFRKKTILAKVETTYGQDATPTGAANAIQVTEITITPMNGQTVVHDYVRPDLGARPEIPVDTHVLLEFKVSAQGSGTPGTPPGWGTLMRGCAMAEVITPGTSAAYHPVSSNEEALTMYFNIDGNLHKTVGAKGSVAMDFTSGQLPFFTFKFVGLYVGPAAAAAPAIDLTPFKTPLPVNDANTPTFTLHGYQGILKTLTLDVGANAVHRDYPNSRSVIVSDRKGSGKTSLQAPSLADKDFFADALNVVLDELQLVHGTVAGSIVQVDAPKIQVKNPTYSDDQGVAMLDMDLVPTPNTGDDELVITAK